MKYAILLALLLAGPVEARPKPASFGLAEALRAGLAAEASGDAAGMMQAVDRLHRLGAHPVEGEPDLAAVWAQKAQALGGRPVAAYSSRGRVLGPAYRRGELRAGAQFSTRQSFIAGQSADIAVEPVGAVQLELTVTEGDGTPVCTVSASRKGLGCRWVPTVTDINIITVTNPGPQPAGFYLILN